MTLDADVLAPVKAPRVAKSRLRSQLGGRADHAHADLALAFALDTLAAAAAARHVRRVVAICSDAAAARALRADGVLVIPDEPGAPDAGDGLNAALRHGAAVLRAWDAGSVVVALQADLPALLPADLDGALGRFADSGAARGFCADHTGTGTTLLAARPPSPLGPRFGPASAAAHAASGAVAITGDWPSLRLDVDTVSDLTAATALGLGTRSATVLAAGARPL